jgi:hypothetical protein
LSVAGSAGRENVARTLAAGETPLAEAAGARPATWRLTPVVKPHDCPAAMAVPSAARIAVVSSAA